MNFKVFDMTQTVGTLFKYPRWTKLFLFVTFYLIGNLITSFFIVVNATMASNIIGNAFLLAETAVQHETQDKVSSDPPSRLQSNDAEPELDLEKKLVRSLKHKSYIFCI